jgi:signal transduction histidine kinase
MLCEPPGLLVRLRRVISSPSRDGGVVPAADATTIARWMTTIWFQAVIHVTNWPTRRTEWQRVPKSCTRALATVEKPVTSMGVGEVDADTVPLLGGSLLLLGVTFCVPIIFIRVIRKRRRELGSRISDAIMHEREHIARELHDILAHHVTVMIAVVNAAKRRLTFDDATIELGAVETVGRDALAEMRRLLGRLHIGPEQIGPPGLDQLPMLMARVEQAGLSVRLTVRGEQQPLPECVDANAYRIIQEALTNTLRHAGPTRADVVVGYQPRALQLRIHDSGVGGVAGSGGYGFDGMRQRVARLGGEIAVGPRPGGGFEVAVELPVNNGKR